MTEAPATHQARIPSIDVARGIAIVGMIAANVGSAVHFAFPGGETYPTLLHARWEGCTLADIVFPLFLFLMGVSIALSIRVDTTALESHSASASPTTSQATHGRPARPGIPWSRVVRRSAILVALGLGVNALNAALRGEALFRPDGTLQRIGLVYLISLPICLRLSPKARVVLPAAGLVLYAAALEWLPFPGVGPADLSEAHLNFSAWLDLQIFGEELARLGPNGVPTSTQGLLALVSSSTITLLGTVTGESLRDPNRSVRFVATRFAIGGLILIALGLACGTVHPISKTLWSSPFVLYTVGISLIVTSAVHILVEGAGYSGPPIRFLEIAGRNALAAYLVHVPAIILVTATLRGFYTSLQPALTPAAASLVIIACALTIVYVPISYMNRRGILWRL